MEKPLAILLALYASTVAVLLVVHLYTPMSPSTVVLALLGLYVVTVVALLSLRPGGRRPGLLVYLLAAVGLAAVLPLIVLGALLAAAALLILLPLAALVLLLLR